MIAGLDNEQAYRLQFLGYGDPRSRVWFVGIEEGGNFNETQPAAHKGLRVGDLQLTYDPTLPAATGRESSVWRISRQLAQGAELGSGYFLSNMAPFPRPSIQTPLAGINADLHMQLVREVRIPLLGAAIQELRPAAVVFHGKSAWRSYRVREHFCLPPKEGRVLTYPEQGLAFAPFFSRRHGILSANDQDMLVAFIRQACQGKVGLDSSTSTLDAHP